MKIYISPYHDVYKNVAIERYLFEHAKEEMILFLWSNEPCVVFGRNQNVYNEVNIEYAKEKDIKLVRRFSGGGAVYQDLGNLNYTFITNDESEIDELNELLIEVFENLGIYATFSGRNDLLVDDKKFSGIAYCNDFDHLMYHGTCLIDVDVEELVKVLKPHDYKLKSHSVSSYKTRVINLNEIKKVTALDIVESFKKVMGKHYQVELIEDIDISSDIQKIVDLLTNEDYIYNDCPSFLYSIEMRLNNSNYHLDLEYKNGVIEKVNIYTDDLNNDKKDFYYQKLIGRKISFYHVENYLKNLMNS